jgi:TolB-like protein/Tfp pilus assembly protein PilF
VLPFSNLSEDSAQEYFSDRLTEEVIAQLGTLCRGRVGVLARWSSMAFKGSLQRARDVGDALRADYLLEGSVRREGGRVRVAARLIETQSETQTWSDTYDLAVGQELATQAEVAARFARALAMELAPTTATPGTAPPDASAYESYLKGRYYWNKPGDTGLDQALAYFGEGLRVAPTFAAAHAALARARDAALRALELDPDHGEAHLALADVRRMLDLDWRGAESSYARALALNHAYDGVHRSYGLMLSGFARHADAIRESERARELDPSCLIVATSDAWMRYAAGDYEAAIARCAHTIDLDPDYLMPRRVLGAAYLAAGREADAVAALEAAVAVDGDDPVVLSWLAHAKAVTGARAEATALLDRARALEPVRYVPAFHLALASFGLGDLAHAFALLNQAWLDRDPVLSTIAVEPRLAPLRDDARYAELLERLHMPGLVVDTQPSPD